MQPDFYNAFCRHASDADLLLECKRWANADHLYGIAAECALKALLQIQGISFAENCTSSDRKYWVHINKLHCAAVDELRTVIEKARINGVLP